MSLLSYLIPIAAIKFYMLSLLICILTAWITFLYLQMGEVLLPNLMAGNCHHRICVRVSRFWDFYDPVDEKKLLHTDMVLADEELGKPNFNFTFVG